MKLGFEEDSGQGLDPYQRTVNAAMKLAYFAVYAGIAFNWRHRLKRGWLVCDLIDSGNSPGKFQVIHVVITRGYRILVYKTNGSGRVRRAKDFDLGEVAKTAEDQSSATIASWSASMKAR